MKIPAEYRGREQTYLKHRVLSDYLDSWAHKMASMARAPSEVGGSRRVRLWYVDCFAGPWQAQREKLEDTSVAIGLGALEQAASTWQAKGYSIELSAIFVEKDRKAYERLAAFLSSRSGSVELLSFRGAFGDHVEQIHQRLGDDPAFLFVDPTGWKGAGMGLIAPLARARRRDVLINVMFNHLNRFKNDSREFLRHQMRDFFGLREGDIPDGLGEEDLFSLYRRNLREHSKIPFAADLAIPHPTADRTWFRLVVGGHHPAVVELFRDVEQRICGAEAGQVRDTARTQASPQLGFDLQLEQDDASYRKLLLAAQSGAVDDVVRRLRVHAPQSYGGLWPDVLCDWHINRAALGRLLQESAKQGRLTVKQLDPTQKALRNGDLLDLPPGE